MFKLSSVFNYHIYWKIYTHIYEKHGIVEWTQVDRMIKNIVEIRWRGNKYMKCRVKLK